jgi:hypothetical protein
MSVQVTSWAADVIRRSVEAAHRFNPDAHLRLFTTAGVLHQALCDGPDDGDQEVPVHDLVIFVAADVSGMVDVELPHDRLTLRPPGSIPHERP